MYLIVSYIKNQNKEMSRITKTLSGYYIYSSNKVKITIHHKVMEKNLKN